MNLIYTPKAWLSLDRSIDFLRLQEIPESKISEIVEEVLKKTETLKHFPNSGQKEPQSCGFLKSSISPIAKISMLLPFLTRARIQKK